MKPAPHRSTALALCVVFVACGGDAPPGKVRVSLQPEDTITHGLSAGSQEENTKDYDVSYSKFIVAVGNVRLAQSRSDHRLQTDTLTVVDLSKIDADGVELASFDDVPSGTWDQFGYEVGDAEQGVESIEVDDADLQTMIDNGWTYWIEGRVDRAQAEGGPVDFVIQTAVPTLFDKCGIDGKLGLTVLAHGTATGVITIHGDHIWFNSFPSGSEGVVERRAAWIFAADENGDGKVTTQELASLDATKVFTTELGYRLDGPEGIPIDTALDFVRAQLVTNGHFKGEGECIWHYEGAEES
jgi:hypothetical protein